MSDNDAPLSLICRDTMLPTGTAPPSEPTGLSKVFEKVCFLRFLYTIPDRSSALYVIYLILFRLPCPGCWGRVWTTFQYSELSRMLDGAQGRLLSPPWTERWWWKNQNCFSGLPIPKTVLAARRAFCCCLSPWQPVLFLQFGRGGAYPSLPFLSFQSSILADIGRIPFSCRLSAAVGAFSIGYG